VLQLPVAAAHAEVVETRPVTRSFESRVALDRVSFKPGMASILVPNQGAVLLWQSLRSTATSLSIALAQSFRRFKAHKQHPIKRAALPARADAEKIEAMLKVTLPNTPPTQKPGKKLEANAAA
jgi:hypothetical protein